MAGDASLLRRLGGIAGAALLCLVAAELAARAFWSAAFGVPFLAPDRILEAWYPKLARVERQAPRRDDGVFDVLLLGGSVLHPDWGRVPQELRRQLGEAGVGERRIFDLSEIAHTSRDSLLKYAALGDARFDLVVVYHGINETRANNVPPALFRADYSHYAWYEVLNALAPYEGKAHFALPLTARYAAVRLRQLGAEERYVPLHRPNPAWLVHGAELRSQESFRDNLSAILALAHERGDPVLLATFATYVPDDYSAEAFAAKRLDYAHHLVPLERWGLPANVVAGVRAHNAVVESLAPQATWFVDAARLMPHGARYFEDACHLTPDGSQRLVELLLEPVLATRAGATLGPMSSPESVVRDFCAAFSRRDIQEILGFFAEDAVYHNMPIAPVKGRAAIEAVLKQFVGPATTSAEFEVHNLAVSGRVVLTERVDRFSIDGKDVALPVMGSFEVDDAGRIRAWRDYFDMNQFTKQLT